MNINFKCEDCKKHNVCKYAEIEVPEIISKIEGKLDNESCPDVIEFYVTCKEFERKSLTTRDTRLPPKFPDWS